MTKADCTRTRALEASHPLCSPSQSPYGQVSRECCLRLTDEEVSPSHQGIGATLGIRPFIHPLVYSTEVY